MVDGAGEMGVGASDDGGGGAPGHVETDDVASQGHDEIVAPGSDPHAHGVHSGSDADGTDAGGVGACGDGGDGSLGLGGADGGAGATDAIAVEDREAGVTPGGEFVPNSSPRSAVADGMVVG